MNDWLDIMLEEIDRKKRESAEAKIEAEQRSLVAGHSEKRQKKNSDRSQT